MDALLVIAAALLLAALVYQGVGFRAWSLILGGTFVLLDAPLWIWLLAGVPIAFLNIVPLRRRLLTQPIVRFLTRQKLLPTISETERTAIEAGNIWIDGDLFSGKPDLKKLTGMPGPELSKSETQFIENQVETLCKIVTDWEIYARRDFPPEVWDYLKKERFFGLIIPEEYGGHGFSASGHSAVVTKIASRSVPLGITVMVPNSLGPAELLTHYGTDEQKSYYLPRLARGEEIPCFALTEAGAGSDAGAMTSSGDVFQAEDGKLYIRLNWKKRYITLASIATVLGLAFKLRDPENLLGKGTEPGITCALIPTSADGVVLGKRHDPLGVPFVNSPTEGRDVVIPVDAIIGGPEQAGNGWRMLMESLAVGRGVSLPATAAGNAMLVTRVAGAYARVRKQFGTHIGAFGGIEEPLARIGGYTYMIEAMRRYTCAGLDRGEKPAVVTAMAKLNSTELSRFVINDALDIVGGAGISRGPRNLLAHLYFSTPVSITVEGANILTRTLMIFGQGAIRCHPYALAEINALLDGDIDAFDRAFWGHVGHVIRNAMRAGVLSLSRGWLSEPAARDEVANYRRKLMWGSASFALAADVAMALHGGNLKRMEKLTGRYADAFSWMYVATATLQRYAAEGANPADLPIVRWSLDHAFAGMQKAFEGIYENLAGPWLKPFAIWTRLNPIGAAPSDRLGSKVARLLQVPGQQRDSLTAGVYVPGAPEEALRILDTALERVTAAAPVEKTLRAAVREGKLKAALVESLLAEAEQAGIISSAEAQLVRDAEAARTLAIQVDAFSDQEYMQSAYVPDARTDSDSELAIAS